MVQRGDRDWRDLPICQHERVETELKPARTTYARQHTHWRARAVDATQDGTTTTGKTTLPFVNERQQARPHDMQAIMMNTTDRETVQGCTLLTV
jgi:hypothetical protein